MSLLECFKHKKGLVTGAGKGIGRALVKRLYSYEATVYALTRTQADLDTLKDECPNLNTICVDLENWELTRGAVTNIGRLDCLINNAAIVEGEHFMDIKLSSFQKIMAVNVGALINVSQIVAGEMMKTKTKGSIVNISSLVSKLAFPATTMYCVSKAAVDMLTKTMAVELGRHNIRVNSINNTGVETNLLRDFYSYQAEGFGCNVEEFKSKVFAQAPLGTIEMDVSEMVNATLFMLSDLCPLITGESLVIDGGFSLY